MSDNKYFIVKEKAVPEVLLKVVEAKRLLDSEKVVTIQEATDQVGISRSSFYKYKDDIFPFHESNRGRTITFMLQMDDQPGLLSGVLNVVADCQANTLSVEMLPTINNAADMIHNIEQLNGIHYLKILARE